MSTTTKATAVHSPLPWAIADGHIVSEPLDSIQMVTLPNETEPREHHRGLVALVYGHHVGQYPDRVYTLDHNIHLIVTAVNHHAELVEALRSLLELGRKDTSNPKYDAYYTEARALLARLDAKAQP